MAYTKNRTIPMTSRDLEFVAALDKNTSTTQVGSVASVDESSTLNAGQQINDG